MLANYARWYTFLPPQWSTIPPPLTTIPTQSEVASFTLVAGISTGSQ